MDAHVGTACSATVVTPTSRHTGTRTARILPGKDSSSPLYHPATSAAAVSATATATHFLSTRSATRLEGIACASTSTEAAIADHGTTDASEAKAKAGPKRGIVAIAASTGTMKRRKALATLAASGLKISHARTARETRFHG
jgi:hypothetical protein